MIPVANLERQITPACAAEKRRHAFYAAVFQSAPRGVKTEAQNTTTLFSIASTVFIPSRLCFLLFPAFDFTQLLIFTTPPFCLFHALYFLGFLMGGKRSCYCNVPRSQHFLPFYFRIIFLVLPRRITFCHTTIFCSLPNKFMFQTHSNFYSLPNNFCFQFTPSFIPCREHLLQIDTRTFIFSRNSFRSHRR